MTEMGTATRAENGDCTGEHPMRASGGLSPVFGPGDCPSFSASTAGLSREDVLAWLREEEEWRLSFLWHEADRARREHVGDEVHLRGLIELSNHCTRDCLYCGIRGSRKIERYRMTEDQVMDCVRIAQKLEYGTVVLQSGEDLGLTTDFVADLVRRIKTETGLAVTLSLGERSREELARWREAGADRYLLKHETSDPELFRRIHPQNGDSSGPKIGDSPPEARIGCSPVQSPFSARGTVPSFPNPRIGLLKQARALGYEIGSGVMVGIPGQSYESLADDVMLFQDLDLEMVGIGPFIPHPETPLGQAVNPSEPRRDPFDSLRSLRVTDRRGESRNPAPESQVPATDTMTTKVVALTRLVCPDANIPSTTALAAVNRERGRELGLERGANVWMPNLTPLKYRELYEIYPGKAKVMDTAARSVGGESTQLHQNLLATLARMGRVPGKGPGGRSRRSRGPVR